MRRNNFDAYGAIIYLARSKPNRIITINLPKKKNIQNLCWTIIIPPLNSNKVIKHISMVFFSFSCLVLQSASVLLHILGRSLCCLNHSISQTFHRQSFSSIIARVWCLQMQFFDWFVLLLEASITHSMWNEKKWLFCILEDFTFVSSCFSLSFETLRFFSLHNPCERLFWKFEPLFNTIYLMPSRFYGLAWIYINNKQTFLWNKNRSQFFDAFHVFRTVQICCAKECHFWSCHVYNFLFEFVFSVAALFPKHQLQFCLSTHKWMAHYAHPSFAHLTWSPAFSFIAAKWREKKNCNSWLIENGYVQC